MRPAGRLEDDPAPRERAHVTPPLVNAYSTRGKGTEPVLHASTNPPIPFSAAGTAYLSRCGAKVRNVTRVAWDPHGPGRRCPFCQRLDPAPSRP